MGKRFGKNIRLFLGITVLSLSGVFPSAAAPDQPLGIKGIPDSLGRAFTLFWEEVGGAAGYNVYRRETPRGTTQKINPYVLSIPIFADRIDGKTFYYTVRAVDGSGTESGESLIVDSSREANLIFLAEDGVTTIAIPGKLAEVLRPANNKYRVPLTIALKEESSEDANVVRNVRLQLLRGDTGEEVTDLAFASPDAEIRLGYNVVGGQVAMGAPGIQAVAQMPLIDVTPDQLSLFWFNGVAWIKLGGTLNPAGHTLNVRSARLGGYQLRVSAPAQAISLSKANVFPGLFTPNGDGYNDRVYLILENPTNAGVTGEIFDLNGRFIATLLQPTQTPGIGTTLSWGGKDSSGAVVPSGLYVYRIQGDGKIITGTVSVAR